MLSETSLDILRDKVCRRMSPYRFAHTCGVEDAARRLGRVFLPDSVPMLRGAALLHDIAKEVPEEEQLSLIAAEGIVLTDIDRRTPALFHAYAAPALIRRDFPEFAFPEILSAVKLHTVGSPDMTLFDEIIFLSDYIEETRTYPTCIAVREQLYRALDEGSVAPAEALHDAVLQMLDNTLQSLIKKGSFISEQTLRTRNAILAGKLYG